MSSISERMSSINSSLFPPDSPITQAFSTFRENMTAILSDKKMSLIFNLAIVAFFAFPFSICSFVVAGTSNAGFNVVLTAILNIGYVSAAIFIVNTSKTPIAIGFLLGSSFSMSLLNLLTAIYWGQLSKCTSFAQSPAQYTCSQPDAYGAVSAFAVLLFLAQLSFTGLLYHWRGFLADPSTVAKSGFEPTTYSSLPNPHEYSALPDSNSGPLHTTTNSGRTATVQKAYL